MAKTSSDWSCVKMCSGWAPKSGSELLILGMVIPPLIGNPYSAYFVYGSWSTPEHMGKSPQSENKRPNSQILKSDFTPKILKCKAFQSLPKAPPFIMVHRGGTSRSWARFFEGIIPSNHWFFPTNMTTYQRDYIWHSKTENYQIFASPWFERKKKLTWKYFGWMAALHKPTHFFRVVSRAETKDIRWSGSCFSHNWRIKDGDMNQKQGLNSRPY